MLLRLLYDVDKFALIWFFTKRAAIVKRVDDLGDEVRPAIRKGWLAYIKTTYGVDPDHYDVAMGQGDLVVPGDA